MSGRKVYIIVSLLFLVILQFSASAFPGQSKNSVSSSGINAFIIAAAPCYLADNLSPGSTDSFILQINPGAKSKLQLFLIVEPGLAYGFAFILVLLMLWYYRRFEIKRIKRLSYFHYQNELAQGNNESSGLYANGNEELIDQCLTGMCDKRVCYFRSVGNIIYLADNYNEKPEPASVEVLRSKIDADKFCDRLCPLPVNQNFLLSTVRPTNNSKDQKNLPSFSFSEIQVKPKNHADELNRSNGDFYLSISKPVLQNNVSAVSPLDQEFINNAARTVKEYFPDYRFSVEQLARKMNMSVSQLNRKLNALTGQTAGRLISSFRLQAASHDLIQTTDTISEVCFNSGYNGIAYFSRAFKREFGCTPSVYRQLMTKKSISVHK